MTLAPAAPLHAPASQTAPQAAPQAATQAAPARVGSGQQLVRNALGEKVVEGEWDPRPLVTALCPDPAYWRGRRVLDIGANTLGLSLELARMGARVHAIEPDPFDTLAQYQPTVRDLIAKENLSVTIERAGLFDAHRQAQLLGIDRFDTVLCLGLIYHFRDPLGMLLSVAAVKTEHLFISSQTHPGEDFALVNRTDPKHYPRVDTTQHMTGWHPTRPMLVRMLRQAGYTDIIATTDPAINFPNKPIKKVTNSAYYRATWTGTPDAEVIAREYCPR
jgi:SAM-dependent methyltransferase